MLEFYIHPIPYLYHALIVVLVLTISSILIYVLKKRRRRLAYDTEDTEKPG